MNPSDRKAFAELLANVMAQQRRDVSTFMVTMWWEACKPFELEQISLAFSAHFMDPERCHFNLQPGDIVRVLQGTKQDRSLVAWGKVYDAMQRVGAYQSVAFDDPSIHLAVEDIGGWVSLCRTMIDELPFVQKRFCDAYKTHTRRPDTPYPSRLIGISEVTNSSAKMSDAQREFIESQTVLVGEKTRVLEVIAGGGNGRRHDMEQLQCTSQSLPKLISEAIPAVRAIR